MLKLFPKKIDFFDLFKKAVQNLNDGAVLIDELMENFDNLKDKVKKIREIEQEGDILTHEVIKSLNTTFITPIDREDIHELITAIDDVLDFIWAVADRIVIFKMKESTKEMRDITMVLLNAVETLVKAIRSLSESNYSYLNEYCIEINRLENKAEDSYREGVSKLFEEINDPIKLIKQKEIYDYLEKAVDTCEDVANILQGIVLKHA